jgi:DNA-binding NarL/FixJ family response regulator
VRIDYDKVSGALYIKLCEGRYDHTEDFSEKADVYLDVDAEAKHVALEALSFEDLAQAVEERGGKLEVPERLALGEGEPSGVADQAIEEAGATADQVREQAAQVFAEQYRESYEVLRLLAQGMSNREIAESLSISQAAVRLRLKAVSDALGRVMYQAEGPTAAPPRRSR